MSSWDDRCASLTPLKGGGMLQNCGLFHSHARAHLLLPLLELQRGGECGTVFSPLRMSKKQHTAKLRLLLIHVNEKIVPKSPSVDTGAPRRSSQSFFGKCHAA